MNKIASVLAGIMLTFGLAACNEDFNEDVASPQANAQAELVSYTLSATTTGTIDLNTVSADTVQVAAYTPISATAGTTDYVLIVDDTASYTISAGGYISADTLQNIVVSRYGRTPTARSISAVVRSYVKTADASADTVTIVGQSSALTLSVVPQALYTTPYYTLTVGGNTYTTTHSSTNVYDDPAFTLTFEAAAGSTWTLADSAGTLLGVNGDAAALTGTLSYESTTAGTIATESWYRLDLDMQTRTYTLTALEVSPYLWTPGNQNGWSHAQAEKLYSASMNMVYTGFLRLNGEFKFTAKNGWVDGYSYGLGSTAGTISADPSAGNLTATEGAYYATVNLTELTYTLTPITTIGIVGDASPGGWDNDVAMTYNSLTNMWEVTTTLSAGSFKFRANNDWGINLGAAAGSTTLVQGGDNISVTTAGTYKIAIYAGNDETSYYTLTAQ